MINIATTHLIEYFHLSLTQDEPQAINRWAGQFLRAREARLLDTCQQLLRGIKSSEFELSPRSRAVVLHCQALLAALFDKRDEAEAGYRRSLALFRQEGDEVGIGWALNDLGTLHFARGEWAQAVECYREALTRLRPFRAGMTDEAMVRNNLGLALMSLGQDEAGIVELEQALDLYRRLGQAQQAAKVQINLGQMYHRRGDIARALEIYQNALQPLRKLGDRPVEVEVLNSLGVLYRYQGRLDQAITYHTESLSLAQTLNDLSGQAQALGNLGAVYQIQSKLPQARSCYQEALALYELLDDRQGQAQMWGNLGHLLSFENETEAALTSYQHGLEISRQISDRAGEVAALINVAGAYRDLKQYDEAESLYQAALTDGRQLGDTRLQDKALGALGTLCLLQQRWAEAEALLCETLTLQERRGDAYAQVETRYKLGRLAREQGQNEQVRALVEPAWELALEHDYGRWLVDLARLLGDAARELDDPAGLNYYAAAVVFACQYGDERRFQSSLAFLGRLLADSVKVGKTEATLEVCQYLADFWGREEWQEWTGPAITYIKATAEAIRAGCSLPLEI